MTNGMVKKTGNKVKSVNSKKKQQHSHSGESDILAARQRKDRRLNAKSDETQLKHVRAGPAITQV